MKSKKWEKGRSNLKQAASEKDDTLRRIKVVAVISEVLKEVGEEPILVGGAAVAFYTNGDYTTNDIDMIASSGAEIKVVMSELGFDKLGKDFVNKDLGIYVEFPSDAIGPTESYDILKVGKSEIRIISIEDLIVDRLAAYKFWKSGIDGLNALRMLELGKGDRRRIEERAREEDVLDALDYIEDVLEQSIRRKLSVEESNALLERYFRK